LGGNRTYRYAHNTAKYHEASQVVEVPWPEAPSASPSPVGLLPSPADLAFPPQRVRQTWNKYNLFNLLRLRTPFLQSKTFFQQKWVAKSLTRGYHGEHIKEQKWERMFSRRPLSAVNMDPIYMANHNGSEQASGRGSGVSNLQIRNRGNFPGMTPYMQMVFAPMERRLDIAIFRALFASSARQARQFVIHGAVTVNGKKVLSSYPERKLLSGVADMPRSNLDDTPWLPPQSG
jgi:ribosomal protein S4